MISRFQAADLKPGDRVHIMHAPSFTNHVDIVQTVLTTPQSRATTITYECTDPATAESTQQVVNSAGGSYRRHMQTYPSTQGLNAERQP